MKQIKDYINKKVAVYCDSQEEWNQMVELISKEIGIKCEPNRNYSKNTTNTLNLNYINKISSNIGVSNKGGYPEYTNYLASDFLEDDILEKCKKKYPPGTKFMTMAAIPKLETIKGIVRWSSSGIFIADDNDFVIYEKYSNRFAEIIEEAQFVKETVKEWYPGTYVVCIEYYGSSKIGDVDEIIEAPDRNNLYRTKKEGLANQKKFKWFATKAEAEEFAKSLLNNNTMEEYKVGNWVIYIGDFSDNFNGLKNKAYEIINIRAGFIAALKTNTSNKECYCKNIRKALPHEIPKQTIHNYPLTKEECTFDLSNTKMWLGDNPEHSKKEIFPSDLGIYEKIPELPNTIDVIDLKRSDVLSENILDFPTANRVIYSTPKVTLTELELPAPIKVIKREESYY